MKKIYNKLILLILLSIGIFLPYWITESSPSHLTFTVGPYTQNVTNNSITILWETSTPTRYNIVEYGENTSYGYRVVGEANTTHHEITIHPSFSSGHYKVISDSLESRDLRFKLATDSSFRYIIYGDSRGVWDNWLHAKKVAYAINLEHPDIVIHDGDMVRNGRDETQWTIWLDFMKPLMQNTTVFTVLGNHEENGDRYYEIFALPDNEKWYSFDYGSCHFIILDNYESYDKTSEQYNWLKKDLSSTSKPFKIVCMHEPIYCSGRHEPRRDIRRVWEPLFKEYDVNLVFQSHNHYYQRTNPIDGVTYIVTGGGGAPLYDPVDASFINISVKDYHYCVLDVSESKIICYAKYINGTVFDEFIISPLNARIIKPRGAMYLFNRRLISLPFTIVIGAINIEVKTSNNVNKVEFYIDNELVDVDYTPPYEWFWNKFAIGRYDPDMILI